MQTSRPDAHHKDCLILLHLLCFAEVMSSQPLGQRLACTPTWFVSSQGRVVSEPGPQLLLLSPPMLS